MKIDFLMYKVVLALLAMAGVAKTSYAQQEQDMSRGYPNHRVLVAYFSATGTTARVAGKVAQATGGELYAITPAESYTSADLDWNDKQSRSSVEMSDPASRPAIGGEALNADGYDVIFLGYPVWCGGVEKDISRHRLERRETVESGERRRYPRMGR